jgi:putative addiction module killer protein
MSKEKQLQYYTAPNGKTPFLEWLASLKDKTILKRIRNRMDRVQVGHYGDHEHVGEGVYEIKLHFGTGYRIYFAEHGEKIIFLLCAGDKATQTKDIGLAKQFWQDIKGKNDEYS